jgi:hypothetical protein
VNKKTKEERTGNETSRGTILHGTPTLKLALERNFWP